jgi:ABC-type branched-subunit amino acid transport system ATPase component
MTALAPTAVDDASESLLPLHSSGVTVAFGGLVAVDDVAIDIRPDEIVGLIGGNGAGKTTFMNVVSGYVEPRPGATITAFGEDLLGLAPEHRPYRGVGRSYQAATLFPGLTVCETLLVAVERHSPTPLLGAIVGSTRSRRIERDKREQVDALVEVCGLGAYADKLVRELSTGTRRVVDIACILAQRPGLLLLDEPTGGLAQRETEAFAPLIKRLQRELGCAVMVIEHDMVMIGELCDRVYAMETGRVIAEGPPDAVRNDPRVISSYLGTDESAIARSGTWSGTGPAKPVRRREPLRAGPDLEALDKAALLARARAVDLHGRSRMSRAQLIEALVRHEVALAGRGNA